VKRFVPGVEVPPGGEQAIAFAFRDGELLVTGEGQLPLAGAIEPLRPVRRQFLGWLDGVACLSYELAAEADGPTGYAFQSLRPLYGQLDDVTWTLAGRAFQVVAWERDHAFCGRCATPTEPVPGERARRCPACGLSAYPRLAPAVIVLVERDDGRALLARGAAFPRPWYSTLAGFVEPGETLEEAVAREIEEEAGITVADIRYFGSQPWPFPNSLMIGFTARHAGGELRFDPIEIVDGGWFAPDDLPHVPGPPSIASRLIQDWLSRSR
jgi:NAD+ diphosphatase